MKIKLVEGGGSPYWRAKLHVGYDAAGHKKFSVVSSRVLVDPERFDESKALAERRLIAMQEIALEAMAVRAEGARIEAKRVVAMVEGVLRASGVNFSGVKIVATADGPEGADRRERDKPSGG